MGQRSYQAAFRMPTLLGLVALKVNSKNVFVVWKYSNGYFDPEEKYVSCRCFIYLANIIQNCNLAILAHHLFRSSKGLIYLGDYPF